MKNTFIITVALTCMVPGLLHAVTATISNAEPRRDIQGNILDAHDGCLEYFQGRFYLYGTRYGKTDGFGKTNRYVCFSSPDLATWTARGEMLKDAPPRTYYRPYVKFNMASGKYVMWYNADNQYGVAVADHPSGPFIIRNPNIRLKYSKRGIGDMGLFVDDDGTGYIAYTVGVGGDFGVKVDPIPHHQICVEKLTPDYLSTTQETSAFMAGNAKAQPCSNATASTTCCSTTPAASAPVAQAQAFTPPLRRWGRSPTAATLTSGPTMLATCLHLGPFRPRAGPTASSRPSRPT